MALTHEQISDRIEIEEVLTRYCYALDDREWDLYRSLFTMMPSLTIVSPEGFRVA